MSNNNNRKTIRESIKKEISYRQSYKCLGCEDLLPPSFQIDHIIPWSLSHDDSEENLQALCPNCHSIKTQRESLRIIQYKRLQNDCPQDCSLCWFCLETYETSAFCKHVCDKVLKDIPRLIKTQSEIQEKLETILNKYKYINHKPPRENTLRIKISVYSNTIYVDNVIVKFKEELFIDDIIEAVFLATRSKKYSGQYEIVEVTLENNDDDDDDNTKGCINFLENSDLLDQLPPRIFKDEESTIIVFL